MRAYRANIRRRIGDLKWDVLALFLARRDPRVPPKARLAIVLAVGYFFSPIDLIPDFIPVIGQLDELVIVSALAAFALRSIPGRSWASTAPGRRRSSAPGRRGPTP
ncbi:MAG: DUF1232 domain-containing protein [Euryarchaeota archaeon]|nr:DUF1232 domain-containing protein [Euryarchaeota archaeon]